MQHAIWLKAGLTMSNSFPCMTSSITSDTSHSITTPLSISLRQTDTIVSIRGSICCIIIWLLILFCRSPLVRIGGELGVMGSQCWQIRLVLSVRSAGLGKTVSLSRLMSFRVGLMSGADGEQSTAPPSLTNKNSQRPNIQLDIEDLKQAGMTLC